MSVADYAARWYAAQRPALAPRTREGYRHLLDRWILPRFGACDLAAVRGAEVSAWLAGLPLAPSARKNVHALLRALYAAAVRDELVAGNPTLGRAPRVPRREAPHVRPHDAARMLTMIVARWPHLYPLFAVLARTGMRIGEVLGLQWADLDFVGRTLEVARSWDGARIGPTKGRRARRVDMAEDLGRVLRAWRELQPRDPWCFPSTRRGNMPWRPNHVQAVMRTLRRDLGLPGDLTPKAFRHGFASTLLALGEPLVYVQRQLGHRSVTLTADVYGAHEPMRRLAAVDRLAETQR